VTLKNVQHNGKMATYIAADPPLALEFFIHLTKMSTNADLTAKEIQSNPLSEVSVSHQSPAESMVQALVADQSIINTLSQAILSAIKQDLPQHVTELSQTNNAAAPVGQSAEQSAVESGPNWQHQGSKKRPPNRCCCHRGEYSS